MRRNEDMRRLRTALPAVLLLLLPALVSAQVSPQPWIYTPSPDGGNADTATALAANGANCSAGNYPLGVDASGAAESCTSAASVPGGTITCGAAGTQCKLDSLYTAGPLLLESDTATTADPAFSFQSTVDMTNADFLVYIGDSASSTLFRIAGNGDTYIAGSTSVTGAITAGTSITAGAGNAITFSGRSRFGSASNGTLEITNQATTDFDTLTLGPSTPADIGVVTLASANTGTAGFRLLSNTAASGGVDIGVTISTAGDLASGDFALKVQDNGTTDLLTLTGTGGLTVAAVTATGGNITTAGNFIDATSASPLSGDACTAGTFQWDTGFFYICTASGAYKRVALTGGY